MTVLLDANVLSALLVTDHGRHPSAGTWFPGVTGGFATCPVTRAA